MNSWSHHSLKSTAFIQYKVHVPLILTGKTFYVMKDTLTYKIFMSKGFFFHECVMFKF
jgi:hypothetical protein